MAIVVNGLRKAFGDNAVFTGFSCRIEEGEVTCITGASGEGKTTFLRILMGLESADAGTIVGLEGRRFSAVFQEDRLCENLSAYSNVLMVCKETKTRQQVQDTLAAVGLAGHEYRPVRELSGGMRRRVAIVRALLADYDILVLDEAFKELDEETKGSVLAYAAEQTRGKTVVMATHDLADAETLGAVLVPLK